MKLEEVTVEYVQKKYIQEIFKKMLVSVITIINDRLRNEVKSIVEDGRLRIPLSAFDLGDTTTFQRNNLIEHLDEFYDTWEVSLKSIGNTHYIYLNPYDEFEIMTDMGNLSEEVQEPSLPPKNESVESRSDILDL